LLLLVSCLGYPSTLKMETMGSSKTSGFLQTASCYKPEDRSLHSNRHENLNFNRYSNR
jgi:hypothetical protein